MPTEIYYTDDRVRKIFEEYLGMNEQFSQHLLTQSEIKDNIQNTGIQTKNNYSYVKEYNVAGKNLEYADLLRRNLLNNGPNMMKLIGTQQSLMMMNPRMNFILNPLAVPGLEPPNGILHHSLDGMFITYPDIVNFPEAIRSPETAAFLGTNLGQSQGSDFQIKRDLTSTLQTGIENLFNSISTIASNDPTKAKLIDRLKNFNNLGDENDTPVKKFAKMNGEGVNSWKFNTDGSTLESMERTNIQKFKDLKEALDTDFEQDFLDFGEELAQKNWETFNLKSSKQSVGIKWGDDKLHVGKFGKYKTNSNELEEEGNGSGVSLAKVNKTISNVFPEDNADSIKEISNDQQFPFFFEEVGDKDPGWCILPATIKSLAENFTPNFSEGSTYIGRTEKPVVYGGTQRTISFSLTLYVEDPKDFQVYKDRILWLSQRTYPKYHEDNSASTGLMTIFKNAPLLRMTIGDLYYRLGGYLSQLSYNWGAESNMWEKSSKRDGNRIPLQCDISLSFNVLHDEVPSGNSQLFAFEGLK